MATGLSLDQQAALPALNGAPVLLYDGTCGFCARAVQFTLRHERAPGALRFASLQSDVGAAVRDAHPELAGVDSVIWYEHSEHGDLVLARSAATIAVLRYLGGGWRLLGALLRAVPRPVRDWGYDVVARHRHQLVRNDASCLLPTPEQRARFLDR